MSVETLLNKMVRREQRFRIHFFEIFLLTVKSWMQLLQNKGIPNLAYYPDNYLNNRPEFQPIYEGLSLSAFPHYSYGEYR